ncbi:VgrG protein [Enhygromyxa salina]|uniref:VgrG protein n=1 Tax=Enhygromyxa salina TaxID=215803 RepID=A0A0C1ZK93_9BACT|nr:phage baseplate assembly protein V [Enhygromyxa salina]KIG17899.1 VgrG protein [Enhygromyxa salina]
MTREFDQDDETLNALEGRLYGKYRGIVVNNEDPDHRGRIEVQATIMGKVPMWALPCVPYAGKDRGMLFLPEEGTSVWVEFEAGDPSLPIWTGCFWSEKDIAPADHEPHIKLIKTEKIEIRIDDKANKISISNANQTILEIEGGEIRGKAKTQIVHQVETMKTALNVTKFDVHDGAMSVT